MCKCIPQDTKCTPQPERESVFSTVFAGWLTFGGIFRRNSRATTKKGRQLSLAKKCTPQEKILATPMDLQHTDVIQSLFIYLLNDTASLNTLYAI